MKKNILFLILTIIFITLFSTISYAKTDIPILMYHAIRETIPNNGNAYLYVTPTTFENQINTIKANGYTFITFTDLVEIENGQLEMPNKPIMITFDDGYLNNYEYAYPILEKLEAKATFFVVTSKILDESVDYIENRLDPMSWEQINELVVSDAVDIQSHSHIHTSFLELTKEEQASYAISSYNLLMEKTGVEPLAISVPYGFSDDATNQLLMDTYKYIVKVYKDKCSYNKNIFYRKTATNEYTNQNIIKLIEND